MEVCLCEARNIIEVFVIHLPFMLLNHIRCIKFSKKIRRLIQRYSLEDGITKDIFMWGNIDMSAMHQEDKTSN